MGPISCCGSHVGIPKDNSRHIPTSLGSNGSVVSEQQDIGPMGKMKKYFFSDTRY
jgi:hypothetical protein